MATVVPWMAAWMAHEQNETRPWDRTVKYHKQSHWEHGIVVVDTEKRANDDDDDEYRESTQGTARGNVTLGRQDCPMYLDIQRWIVTLVSYFINVNGHTHGRLLEKLDT